MMIHLAPHFEKLAPDGVFTPLPEVQLLYHQLRTVVAQSHAALVVNSYNTGTGKTRASLLHLFSVNGLQRNVLFIAPTNALLRQHVDDVQAFVTKHNLDFRVIEVNAAIVRQLGVNLAIPNRSGEKLYRLLQNPLEFYHELGIPADDQRNLASIIIVNPDIFHYMLFFRYGNHDQRNLFIATLQKFWYVIIDEFHYYDEKQLVSFLCFLNLWQEFGYFDQGRKVCILSATPNPQVEAYFTALLGNTWVHVSPDNEPAESGGYEQIQTLTALDLEISSATLSEWLTLQRAHLAQWLQSEQDGAIISNSLARINEAFDLLQGLDICRITGPEPAQQRAQALRHRLLLATPVVDIGYNFDRDKPRQNIDFVVCEGRYRDDLIQRLGRAGRVLGKPEQHHLSQAIALVNPEVVQALHKFAGQTLSRREFRDQLNQLDMLPLKHALGAYLRVHGLVEAFYPIYKLSKMLPPEQQSDEIERLVDRLRTVFAPNSHQGIKGLQFFAHAFEAREKWVLANESEKWDKHGWQRKTLAANLANYFSQLQSSLGKQIIYQPQDVQRYIDAVVSNPTRRSGLNDFILSQYHLTRSLFAFRDSFSGPTAVLYDPASLFSSQQFNTYDVLHLIANYHLHLFANRNDFLSCGETNLEGEFYVQLQHRRIPRLNIEFSLALEDIGLEGVDQKQFEHIYCRCPVALRGIKLIARQKGGDIEPLPPLFRESLQRIYITLLVVPKTDTGAMIASLRNTSIINRPFEVIFADGQSMQYSAILGSSAWHADAALRGHFRMRDRRATVDAIIL